MEPKKESEEAGKIDPSKWKEYLNENSNFDQKVPYVFQENYKKLKLACEDLDNLNPYCTLSPIYDYTKVFYEISSALSMGFSDITEKVNIMRERFQMYDKATSIQSLLAIEISNDIHKLNGSNNKKLGQGKGPLKNYISACRTFLRLLWFLEYLIYTFNKVLADDGSGDIRSILAEAYHKVLAPRHTFLVRKAVGVALTFSGAGDVKKGVKIIFGFDNYDENAKKVIKETIEMMEKIWNAGNEYYKKNNMLKLE